MGMDWKLQTRCKKNPNAETPLTAPLRNVCRVSPTTKLSHLGNPIHEHSMQQPGQVFQLCY